MVAEKLKTGKAGLCRLFPTSMGEFEMLLDYTEERMNGPIEAAAAAMTQVADKLLAMRKGDMLVVAWEDTGIFVASQEGLFSEGKTLGELCTEQKLDQYVAEMQRFVGDGHGE